MLLWKCTFQITSLQPHTYLLLSQGGWGAWTSQKKQTWARRVLGKRTEARRTKDGQRSRATVHLQPPSCLLFLAPSCQRTPPTYGTRPSGVQGDPNVPSLPCHSHSGGRLENRSGGSMPCVHPDPQQGDSPRVSPQKAAVGKGTGMATGPARLPGAWILVNQKAAGNPHAGQTSLNVSEWGTILSGFMDPIHIKPNRLLKDPEQWWACCSQCKFTDIPLAPKVHKHQTQRWQLSSLLTAGHVTRRCRFTFSTRFLYINFLTNPLVSQGFFLKWLTPSPWKHPFYPLTSHQGAGGVWGRRVKRPQCRSCSSLCWLPFPGLQFSQL